MVQVDSLAARCIGALVVLVAACWLIAVVTRDRQDAERLTWSLTQVVPLAFVLLSLEFMPRRRQL